MTRNDIRNAIKILAALPAGTVADVPRTDARGRAFTQRCVKGTDHGRWHTDGATYNAAMMAKVVLNNPGVTFA